jgi:hypothetical protein
MAASLLLQTPPETVDAMVVLLPMQMLVSPDKVPASGADNTVTDAKACTSPQAVDNV